VRPVFRIVQSDWLESQAAARPLGMWRMKSRRLVPCETRLRSALRGHQRLAGERGDLVLRKTGLSEIGNRVFAKRRHLLRRRDPGAGHAERQVQYPERPSSILHLG